MTNSELKKKLLELADWMKKVWLCQNPEFAEYLFEQRTERMLRLAAKRIPEDGLPVLSDAELDIRSSEEAGYQYANRGLKDYATASMLKAGIDAYREWEKRHTDLIKPYEGFPCAGALQEIYKAMLAARPETKKE